MSGIKYYRDPKLPFFEIKSCDYGIHASRRHVHEEFSIGVVMQGTSLVQSTAQDFLVEQDSIIIIPPGAIHRCNPKDFHHWQFQMLYLQSSWVDSLLETKPANLYIAVKKLQTREFQRILRLFRWLRDDLPGLQKETQLITELQHFFDFESYFQQKPNSKLLNPQLMQMVKDYLQSNYLEKISLDDLAGIAGLNKYHLLHCFKTMYKTTPHAYQTMLRINFAKEQLQKKRNEPITAIAQNAGFFDQSHFVKAFKQYLGITPLEYRLGH
jgi:AraC-type DNA-binding domain-containing proteins